MFQPLVLCRRSPAESARDNPALSRYENTNGSHNKFWEISSVGPRLTMHWGRIGTKGQTKTKSFPTTREATYAGLKMIRDKLEGGYHYVRAGQGAAARPVERKSRPRASARPKSAKSSKAKPKSAQPPNPRLEPVVLEGPLNEIDAYPRYLLRYLDAADPKEFVWPRGLFEVLLDEKKGSWTDRYEAAFRGWLTVTAPNGFLWAARGLDRLDGPKSIAEMMSVSGPHAEENDIPATINVVVAGARFGSTAPKNKKKHVRLGNGDVSSVAILKLDTKYIVSLGGDSESGPSHEAEIRIRPCVPCVHRLFVSSPKPIAKTRVATDAERRLYGLSSRIELRTEPKSQDKYGDSMTPFPVSLEKQVRELARRKGWYITVVKTPSDEKAIRGTRWYRII